MRTALILCLGLAGTAVAEESLEELRRKLRHGHPRVRADAVAVVAARPWKETEKKLIQEDLVWALAEGTVGVDEALVAVDGLEALWEASQDWDRDARVRAYQAMRSFSPKQLIRQATGALIHQADLELRALGIEIVGLARDKSVVPVLLKHLNHDAIDIRLEAAVALWRIGHKDPRALNLVVRAVLDDLSPFADDALAKIGADAVPAVTRALQAGSQDVRLEFVRWLRDLKGVGRPAAPALVQLILGEWGASHQLRLEAAEALAAVGPKDPALVPPLEQHLGDPQLGPHLVAALESIGKPAVPALRRALNVRSRSNRVAAIDALGRLGAAATGARDSLSKLRDEGAPLVRVHAAAALWRHGVDAAGAQRALLEAWGTGTGEALLAGEVALPPLGKTVVPWLASVLGHRDANVRRTAALALGLLEKHVDDAALDALAAACGDAHPDVRKEAARALAQLGSRAARAADGLRKALKAEDHPTRYAAAVALHGAGVSGKECIAPLLAEFRDLDSLYREQAGALLGELRATEAIRDLVEAMGTPDEALLRRVSTDALVEIGAPAVSALSKALIEGDPYRSDGAEEALARMGRPARAAVLHLTRSEDAKARQAALFLIAHEPATEAWALTALGSALRDADDRVLGVALRGLAEAGAAAAKYRTAIERHTKSSDLEVRFAALLALESVADDARVVLPALEKAVKSKDPYEAELAMDHLVQLAPTRIVDAPLEWALEQGSEELRTRAARQLVYTGKYRDRARAVLRDRLGSKDGWRDAFLDLYDNHRVVLLEALSHERAEIRRGALRGFEAFGLYMKTDVAAIGRALEDPDPQNRRLAARALIWIGGNAAPVEEALVRRLGDKDTGVRREAARALASNGVRRAESVPPLLRALEDKATVLPAARALASRGKDVVKALIQRLRSAKVVVQLGALLALTEVGGAARDALPELIRLQSHPRIRDSVRALCDRAIRTITADVPRAYGD